MNLRPGSATSAGSGPAEDPSGCDRAGADDGPDVSGSDRMRERATGDTAFERCVLPEIEVLLSVAHSLTRNHAEAEDLVQDILVHAYRAIAGFDGRYPRAWLLTILRNTHIDRHRRRRPELLRDPDLASERWAVSASGDRPDAIVDDMIDVEIHRALDALGHPFRRVVELVDICGLTYAGAAAVIDAPVARS